MIIALHITRINKKKISKITYLISKLKKISNIQIISNYKNEDINLINVINDQVLLDFSTYLYAFKYSEENNTDCLCVNDTFFENKLFYKFRVNRLIKKIKEIGKYQSIAGHVMNYKNRKYIPTYIFYMNYKAISILLKNTIIQELINNKKKSFDIKFDNKEFNLIMQKNKEIYSIHPLSGVKWHNNNYVKSSVRYSKLICSALEQYICNILEENNTLFYDIFNHTFIGNTIYRIENKIFTYKFKAQKCKFINNLNDPVH